MGKRIQVAEMGATVPDPKAFPDGATVRDVLEAFDVELEKGDILSINGALVTLDTVPKDGQCVYISKASSGA